LEGLKRKNRQGLPGGYKVNIMGCYCWVDSDLGLF